MARIERNGLIDLIKETDSGPKIGMINSRGVSIAWGASPSQHATQFPAIKDGTITQLAILISPSVGAGLNLTLGIYDSTGTNGDPGNKIEQTVEYTTVAASEGNSFVSLQLNNPVELTKGQLYWLVAHSQNGFFAESSFTAAGFGAQKYKNLAYSSTLPDPWGTPTADSGGYIAISGW